MSEGKVGKINSVNLEDQVSIVNNFVNVEGGGAIDTKSGIDWDVHGGITVTF